MTPEQIDTLLSILSRFADIAERWADVEYPKRDGQEEVETYVSGEAKEANTPEEYEALPEETGRFERRFNTNL